MHRDGLCLDFRAKRINIEAHVGDDVRFSVTLKRNKEALPATDYTVETFIFNEDGSDYSSTHNFETDPQDGVVGFVLDDIATTDMGAGRWSYVIVITLTTDGDDYDRSYINGSFVLYERSIIS